VTARDKKINKDYRDASILKRARKLYKSGSKVFDESYLKDNEERVLKESKFIGLSRNDIEEVLKVYDERDHAIMANNIFHRLCERGGEWHNITVLAQEVGAYGNTAHVASIAQAYLLEMHLIERDPSSNNVKLTPLGMVNCARGIDIPPSTIQRLKRRLGIR
jgi:hypothetical protein